MVEKGWIKLHRKIQSHWLYEEKRTFSKFEAWIHLLLEANHAKRKISLGNELIEVERGQLITSELKLMNRWNWGKSKTRNFLEMLEKDGMIVKKSDHKKTVITICNYNVYHETENENRLQSDCDKTTSRPSSDTNKNVKNDKNVKNNNKNIRHRFEICDMNLAEMFFNKILENNPNFKKPNLEAWANDIRLMRERDKRTEEQIEYLINWSQSHSFWHTNILSPAKLRKQFDKLVLQVKQDNQQKVTPITEARSGRHKYNLGF